MQIPKCGNDSINEEAIMQQRFIDKEAIVQRRISKKRGHDVSTIQQKRGNKTATKRPRCGYKGLVADTAKREQQRRGTSKLKGKGGTITETKR